MSKLSLIAALALGGLMACSTLATAQQDAPKKKGMTAEERLDAMTTKLDLKDDQKPKVKAVLEETSKKIQPIRSDTSLDRQQQREKMQPIMEEQNKKMKEILTPDQYTKYQDNQKKGKGKKKTPTP